MKQVHIIGQPGAGKTTLTAALISYFTAKGMAVGSLKHSSHSHELDKPGKDSHVHRTAGAAPAAMVTASMAAIYMPASDLTRPDIIIDTYFKGLDLVIIEGWISGPYPKVEIWREAVDRPPLFTRVSKVAALAVQGSLDAESIHQAEHHNIPVLPLDPIDGIAQLILNLPQN